MIFVQEILEGIDNLRNLCIDSETEACPGLCPNDKCAVRILYNKLLKHGRWINLNFLVCKCSVCDEVVYENGGSAYCPNCGARMDEEDNQ